MTDPLRDPKDDANEDDGAEAGPTAKIAVVVIHGMGEQRPMETLWRLVDALWTHDADLVGRRRPQVFSKPDKIEGLYDLRRVTTRAWRGDGGRRVDFFEFYWAHLMTGNSVPGVVTWLLSLLVRSPSSVPARLFGPWLGLWIVFLIAAAISVASALPDALRPPEIPEWIWPWTALAAAIIAAIQAAWIGPVAGDAARYLSATPDNVAARMAIQSAGVAMLKKLHESKDYDRIIIVGHSLGSVVGYDMLNRYWEALDEDALKGRHAAGSEAIAALTALERAAGELVGANADIGAKRKAYRAAQRAYFEALSEGGDLRWLVSDFVTMGSPLSKADVLVAKNEADFRRRKTLRELPTCPPWLEKLKPRAFLSYPFGATQRTPHHASVFAPVVWTNIYFKSFLLLFGDFIGGPVAALMGRGVVDIELEIGAPLFRHLDYWKEPAADPPRAWIKAARKAVNLRRADEDALWGPEAEANPIRAAALT